MRIPSDLRRFLAPLASKAEGLGLPLFVVGGCVRDWTLGSSTRDVDMVTEGEALPLAKECLRLWGGSLEPFGRFGTVRLFLKKADLRIDFARARAETYPEPAALPVVRPATLRDDLIRRDFTVNAMALPLTPSLSGEVIDLHGGLRDLKARRLRVLHPGSFRDDPTRLFRAARYAGRFGLAVEPGTRVLLREAARKNYAGLLSRERSRQELMRILEEKNPGPAMRLLKSWGLMRSFHPDFRWPPAAGRARGAYERLGLAALAMPARKGDEFLASLRLDHSVRGELESALKTARAKASPRGELSILARRVLEFHFGKLPPGALEPLWVSGADLKRLGLAPGREYADWLDDAASAQWRGEFKNREQARRWLADAVGR